MDYAVVAVAAAPIRRKAGHRSEMVNQLLFGETVRVLKQKDELWARVRSMHDNYEGWTTVTLLDETDKEFANARPDYACSGLLNKVHVGEKELKVPFASSLPFLE